MTESGNFLDTGIVIHASLDRFIDEEARLSYRLEKNGDARSAFFFRNDETRFCLVESGADAGYVHLHHPKPTNLDALINTMRRLDVDPQRVSSAEGSLPTVDVEQLRRAIPYPFPDEPNAEVCVITGGRANARVYEDPHVIAGWYGSTVADMSQFIVVDPTLPLGPICDEEILKAVAAGRAIPAEGITWDVAEAMPREGLRALLEFGIVQMERNLLQDPAGALPIGYFHEDDDAAASPFMEALEGRGTTPDGYVDVVGMGRLMALIARARGAALVAGAVRDAALAEAVERFKDDGPLALTREMQAVQD